MAESERQEQIEELFHEVMELPEGRRAARLAEARATDPALADEVEQLARCAESAHGRLDTPAVESLGLAGPLTGRLGAYTLIGLLGEGGMGQVYEAEQMSPRRRVALKVIRAGMATPGMLRRFEFEAAALAQLKHPGIAQIYESGVFESSGQGVHTEGRPYLSMELVKGRRLDEFAAGMPVRGVLELMARIADAVQHAHQRGVIHRDLKPGNILVEENGAEGQPKILDFGIARFATAEPDVTAVTQTGQMIGTLAYMSPEQVRGGGTDVDTRTDVYALGVILYQLLTGRLPHATDGSSVFEAARAVLETEPARAGSLRRELRGDIETIIAKAMEKDRERRYASAAELAADLRRTLANEPIVARPASAVYQLRKFAARHKALVAGVAAVVLLSASASVGLSILYSREQTQRVRADAALLAAERQVRRQRATQEFLIADAFGQASPSMRGPELKVVEVLDSSAAAVDSRFSDDPDLRVYVRITLAHLLWAAGQYQKSLDVSMAALTEFERASFKVEDQALLPSLLLIVGRAEGALDRLESAESRYRRALELSRGLPESLELYVDSISSHAEALQRLGRHEDAEPLLREVLKREHEGPEWGKRSVVARLSLAASLAGRGASLDEVETLLQQAVKIGRDRTGGEANEIIAAMNNLASFLTERGRPDEAVPLMLDALERAKRVYPPGHQSVGILAMTTANALGRVGRTAEARDLVLEGLAVLAASGDETRYILERAAGLAVRVCDQASDRRGGDEPFALWLRCRWLVAGDGESEGVIKRLAEFRTRLAASGLNDEDIIARIDAFVQDLGVRYPSGSGRRARLFANAAKALVALDPVRYHGVARQLIADATAALEHSERPEEDRLIIESAEREAATAQKG